MPGLVGLGERMDYLPRNLSGGPKQPVAAIGLAIRQGPQLLRLGAPRPRLRPGMGEGLFGDVDICLNHLGLADRMRPVLAFAQTDARDGIGRCARRIDDLCAGFSDERLFAILPVTLLSTFMHRSIEGAGSRRNKIRMQMTPGCGAGSATRTCGGFQQAGGGRRSVTRRARCGGQQGHGIGGDLLQQRPIRTCAGAQHQPARDRGD